MAKKPAAAPAEEHTATVQMEALEDHTGFGHTYKTGQTFAAPAEFVESLEVQGKAIRADAARPRARAKASSTAVEPMTIKTTGKRVVNVKPAKRGTLARKDLRTKR